MAESTVTPAKGILIEGANGDKMDADVKGRKRGNKKERAGRKVTMTIGEFTARLGDEHEKILLKLADRIEDTDPALAATIRNTNTKGFMNKVKSVGHHKISVANIAVVVAGMVVVGLVWEGVAYVFRDVVALPPPFWEFKTGLRAERRAAAALTNGARPRQMTART